MTQSGEDDNVDEFVVVSTTKWACWNRSVYGMEGFDRGQPAWLRIYMNKSIKTITSYVELMNGCSSLCVYVCFICCVALSIYCYYSRAKELINISHLKYFYPPDLSF